MSGQLNFSGSIEVPAPSITAGCPGKQVLLTFETLTRQFDKIVSADAPYDVASPSVFTPMPFADELTTIEFISFAVLNAGTIDLLIGDVPRFVGVGGTFPTSFSGGETFAFELQTYNDATGAFDTDFTILTTFTVAAQTAAQVANEINAAILLAGASPCGLVTVNASGQLDLKGTIPGAIQRIEITTANATIGFDGSKVADLGTGSPQTVNGNYVAEFAATPSDQFWFRGTATINILLAGS